MNYKASIPTDISPSEKIVLPISMNQPLERGESLKAILCAIEASGYKHQVTILVCDYLNRHNCKNEDEALTQGDAFINDHAEMLIGYHVLRWKDFLNNVQNHLFDIHLKQIQETCQEESRFYNKIRKTWEKCLSADQPFENSIQYQIEEYTAILCMNEFSHLFYPKRITNGMAYLYHFIEGNKPKYHHIKVSQIKNPHTQDAIQDERFFIGDNASRNHIHIAFRGLLEHMDMLLSSSELSSKSKKSFAEEAENLFMKHRISGAMFEQSLDLNID